MNVKQTDRSIKNITNLYNRMKEPVLVQYIYLRAINVYIFSATQSKTDDYIKKKIIFLSHAIDMCISTSCVNIKSRQSSFYRRGKFVCNSWRKYTLCAETGVHGVSVWCELCKINTDVEYAWCISLFILVLSFLMCRAMLVAVSIKL